MRLRALILCCFLYLSLSLTGCQDAPPSTPAATIPSSPNPETAAPPTPALIPSPTPIPPTPTPAEPLAALVNDQPIFLSRYEKELARYEQAQLELGRPLSAADSSYRAQVLDALIEQTLIAQAAAAAGLQVTPEMVEAKLLELKSSSGDGDNFAAWLQANQWTEEEFRQALAAEMLTELMVNQVTAGVPYAVEQLHARYLQVDDATLAQTLLDQLRNGADFAALARQYSLDPVTGPNGGDLGYFARGSLLVPEVETAAFALAPGEASEVITVTGSATGQTIYYIVQVIERDPQRPLTADQRYELLRAAFEDWLADLWAQAKVQRFINQDT